MGKPLWRFGAAAVSVLAALAVILGATFAGAAQKTPPPTTFKDVASAPGPQQNTVPDDYAIGPQDTLAIAVFQVDDLSRTVRVDTNGSILLPLIGQITATGKTSQQLSTEIATELGKTYLKDPKVTVTIKESTNRRVTIDGAVRQPGIYPISGNTTLSQAIALAQGPSDIANVKEVAIFRNIGDQRMAATFDLSSIRSGQMADPAVVANDVIVVEISGGRRFLRNLTDLVPFARIFRP